MLLIKNVTIRVAQKNVVQDLSLHIKPGTVHAIMGQNGSGKSSLAHCLMGLSAYQNLSGSAFFKKQNLQDLSMQQRSLLGIFLAFQQPISIPGVTVFQFLKEIYHASGQQLSSLEFQQYLQNLCGQVGLDQSFLYRGLHDNFSGGEKKRLEIVQILLLKPQMIILDEIDSGLDVDALRSIGNCIAQYLKEQPKASCLLITHYRRILDYIKPNFVHVMYAGTIVQSGDAQLAYEIEQKGYDIYGR